MNILIRIKSLFSGEGFTAAQSELTATKASAASVKLPQELEKGAAKAEKEVDKLNKQLRGTNSALNATQALARGDVFGAINQSAAALSEKLGNIGKQLGAAFAGFGIGWQVGTMIRDLTGLGNALDKLVVPTIGAQKSLRDMANERLSGLRAELDATKARMEGLTKAADDAAKRVEQAINAKIAKREQAGVQAEQAASAEDRPIVAVQTSLDVSRQELEIARAKTAEEKRNADETAKAIAAEQERLGWAEKQLAEAEAIFKVYKDLGRSEEVAVDVKTASERVDALKKQIEDLRKVAGAQAVALEVTQTAETKAETAVKRAEGGLKEAEARRESDRKAAADKITQEKADQDKRDADARSREQEKSAAAAQKAEGRRLEAERRAKMDQGKQAQEKAQATREAAKTDLDQSAQFRQFALSPRLRVEADKDEREANQKKERDERSYQNLLKRARASGYRAVENAAGDFDVSRDPRVAGTRSKRLADAVRAEAERLKGEREKKEADQLEKDALRAQVESAGLLAKIAANTEQGPVA
jgi:uncharacterized protein involved in tolerance to divalent cations